MMRTSVSKLSRFGVVLAILLFAAGVVVLFTFAFLSGLGNNGDGYMGLSQLMNNAKDGNYTLSAPHRKLLIGSKAMKEPNRIWGERCTKADIVITQGPTSPLFSGIPTYTVEIMNSCVTGCDISRIHLRCGWFSSARQINPKIFKRLRYNDCLVNDGKALVNGGTLSFEYANTYLYPLSVSSIAC